MKIMIKNLGILALFSLLITAVISDAMGQSTRPGLRRSAANKRAVGQTLYTVSGGKRFRVRMNDTISSKTARVGDRFTTTVTEPVYSSTGVVVVPSGSEVVGKVTAVQKAARGGKVGSIDASFVELVLPNGTRRAINGSLTELVSDDAKSDEEGTASGDKMKNRKLIFIGGGGAGGAVLGGIIGGGKGAVIGGILGAGGGLLGERSTRGEEAEVKSGTEFGVYLNQSISLPRFRETGAEAEPVDGGRTYIVQPGDTLGAISRRFYGNSSRYMDIYDANRDRLRSPSSLVVGQELRIP